MSLLALRSPPLKQLSGTLSPISQIMQAGTHSLGRYLLLAQTSPKVLTLDRSAVVTDSLFIPLPNDQQYPQVNKRLIFRVQIPPLPFPVDSNTPDNPLNTQLTTENITVVQPELGRLAWKFLTDQLLDSERWQAVTDLGNGKVLYESREVFRGLGAPLVQTLYEDGLRQGFNAQAEGLRRLLEGCY